MLAYIMVYKVRVFEVHVYRYRPSSSLLHRHRYEYHVILVRCSHADLCCAGIKHTRAISLLGDANDCDQKFFNRHLTEEASLALPSVANAFTVHDYRTYRYLSLSLFRKLYSSKLLSRVMTPCSFQKLVKRRNSVQERGEDRFRVYRSCSSKFIHHTKSEGGPNTNQPSLASSCRPRSSRPLLVFPLPVAAAPSLRSTNTVAERDQEIGFACSPIIPGTALLALLVHSPQLFFTRPRIFTRGSTPSLQQSR